MKITPAFIALVPALVAASPISFANAGNRGALDNFIAIGKREIGDATQEEWLDDVCEWLGENDEHENLQSINELADILETSVDEIIADLEVVRERCYENGNLARPTVGRRDNSDLESKLVGRQLTESPANTELEELCIAIANGLDSSDE